MTKVIFETTVTVHFEKLVLLRSLEGNVMLRKLLSKVDVGVKIWVDLPFLVLLTVFQSCQDDKRLRM